MAMLNIISRSTAASCICPQDFSTCRTEWFVTYFNINKCLWHARVFSIYTFCFVRKAGQCRVFMTLSNISTADSVDASIHVFVWGSDFGFALSFGFTRLNCLVCNPNVWRYIWGFFICCVLESAWIPTLYNWSTAQCPLCAGLKSRCFHTAPGYGRYLGGGEKRLVFAPIFFWGKTGGGCWSLTGGDWANTRHKWTTTFWSYPTHRVFHGKESVQHTCRGVGTWRLQLQPFGWSTFFWTWGRENTLPGSSDATVFFLVLFGSCNQGTTPLRSWSLVQRRNFCSPNVMFQPLYFLRTHVFNISWDHESRSWMMNSVL